LFVLLKSDEWEAKRNNPTKKSSDSTKFLIKSILLHVIPAESGQPVTGITVPGRDVFVVRDTSQVCVYNSTSFTSSHNLKISESEKLKGIVSCSHNNCLYVRDSTAKIIYRYDLSNHATTKWSVNGGCRGLSVTKCYNVLVTLYENGRIQEYTTHGSLIRDISLDSSIRNPRHCVQLSTGNFVVCHLGGNIEYVL